MERLRTRLRRGVRGGLRPPPREPPVAGDFEAPSVAAFDRSTLQRFLVWLVAIKIAGLILILDPTGSYSFDLSKSLFSRATGWLIAGGIVIALLRYGPEVIPRTRLHLAVGAIVIVNVLSSIFAEDRSIALFGEAGRYLGLIFVIDMGVLYLAVAIAFRRLADWAVLGGALVIATAIVLAYAAAEYVGVGALSGTVDSRPAPASTLGSPDALGRYLSLVFGASAGVAALGRGQVSSAVRIVAGFLALAVLATAALSPVRGTLISMAAVAGFVPILYLRMRGGTRRDLGLAALASFAIVSAIAWIVAFTPVGASALNLIRDQSPNASRLLLFDSAWRAFLDRPLLGFGPDGFVVAYSRYRTDSAVGILGDDAHNWLLHTAATTGALGVFALVAAIVMSTWWIWSVLRRRISALAPAFLLAIVGYWVHASITNASISIDWFHYLAFGAVASAATRRRSTPAVIRTPPPVLRAAERATVPPR